MILISHRGNIKEPNKLLENKPSYIDTAISMGYDVEVDIRLVNDIFYLGHDTPDIEVSDTWLRKRRNVLWIHCKDIESAIKLSKMEFAYNETYNYFCHTSDKFVLTSSNHIWVHDLTMNIGDKCIIPLLGEDDINKYDGNIPYGICTDYVEFAKYELNQRGLYK